MVQSIKEFIKEMNEQRAKLLAEEAGEEMGYRQRRCWEEIHNPSRPGNRHKAISFLVLLSSRGVPIYPPKQPGQQPNKKK
jgi:hypothetical protein